LQRGATLFSAGTGSRAPEGPRRKIPVTPRTIVPSRSARAVARRPPSPRSNAPTSVSAWSNPSADQPPGSRPKRIRNRLRNRSSRPPPASAAGGAIVSPSWRGATETTQTLPDAVTLGAAEAATTGT